MKRESIFLLDANAWVSQHSLMDEAKMAVVMMIQHSLPAEI